MLGLRYPIVRLVEHDPRWLSAFSEEYATLKMALGSLGCGIEHVGSTAVPGLPAKPTLDIAVGMPDPSVFPVIRERLEEVGYEYGGDAKDKGGQVFVRADGVVRTHHVHVVPLDGGQWRDYLALRNLLLEDGQARLEYATVKRDLAAQFPEDRRAYMDGKDQIVTALLGRAAHR